MGWISIFLELLPFIMKLIELFMNRAAKKAGTPPTNPKEFKQYLEDVFDEAQNQTRPRQVVNRWALRYARRVAMKRKTELLAVVKGSRTSLTPLTEDEEAEMNSIG